MKTALALQTSVALSAAMTTACGAPPSPGATAPVDAAAGSQADGGRSSGGGDDSGTRALDAATESAPASGGDGGAADAWTGGTSSATLGFIGSAYTLYASIGGGPAHIVQLDTGSIGLYVPKGALGPSAQVSATATCSITYVSSGNTLSGHTATAPVSLLGSKAGGDLPSPPTTGPMSLCAVDDPTFTGGMMGVGFGRGTPADPSRNVMLEMADIQAGTMHPGYVLSTHPSPHVQVGLTAAGSAGFQTIALAPDPGGSGDWVAKSLQGCLSLPKTPAFTPACGGLLVDTGVADCLLWGPADPTLGGVVPAGQTTVPSGIGLQIAAPASGSILSYPFVVGSGADTPAAVSLRKAGAFSINTGRALLVDYDYLFDARNGLVGFRRAQ